MSDQSAIRIGDEAAAPPPAPSEAQVPADVPPREPEQMEAAEVQPPQQRIISADLGELNEIESMCPRCEKTGTTRLMITSIPHFKEIIVSSFDCPHCGERNNAVQYGGAFGDSHTHYELQVKEKKDLNRQVVKSEYATIVIPQLDLEIPPESQRGSLNTVEGVLEQTIEGLKQEQPLRKHLDPETYEKIEAFCAKLEEYKTGSVPFTMHLDDPAGNSYIEAYYDYYHPTIDPQLTRFEKPRTDIDYQVLGLPVNFNSKRTDAEEAAVEETRVGEEVMQFPTQCPACRKDGQVNMHQTVIPYFKETMIMAFKCEFCGYRSNEIKSSGDVSEKGVRLTLKVSSVSDLARDVLKSETASLHIPEVHLELAPGTLGGFFSSVEGTITQVRDQLLTLPQAQFAKGDAASASIDGGGMQMSDFIEVLSGLLEVKTPFTFILDDPLGNVYIQNPRAHLPPPENADPQLEREEYTRTHEQDEELGLLPATTSANDELAKGHLEPKGDAPESSPPA